MAAIGLYASRGFQVLFSAVVLGLGAKLAIDSQNAKDTCKFADNKATEKYCNDLAGGLITIMAYSAFTGAFGLLDALVGSVAAIFSAIPWLVPIVLDGMAAIFFLAGGINAAVKRNGNVCGISDDNHFCTQYDATDAFMFLGFIATLVAAVFVFLHQRKR